MDPCLILSLRLAWDKNIVLDRVSPDAEAVLVCQTGLIILIYSSAQKKIILSAILILWFKNKIVRTRLSKESYLVVALLISWSFWKKVCTSFFCHKHDNHNSVASWIIVIFLVWLHREHLSSNSDMSVILRKATWLCFNYVFN